MSKATKNKLQPNLRFPEFENDGKWVVDKLENYIDLFSGIALKSEEISDDASGIPILRGINITEGYIRHSKEIDKYFVGSIGDLKKYLTKEHDIVIGMDGSKVGKNVALIKKEDENSILIQRVARIRTNQKSDINYIYHNFISEKFRRYVDTVNTSSGIPHISAQQIKDFQIGFPPKPKEQEKIAACISSLDEVIAGESQKLEMLKVHKKGLLQNLIPQEGETVPKFRFRAFEKSSEWEETTITQVADYENGKAHEQDIVDTGAFIVVNSKFISQDGEVKKLTNTAFCPAAKGDILMVLSDIPNGKAIAKCFLVEEENRYTVNQRICKITPRNINSKILYYLLNRNPYFLAFDDGVKQTNLRKEDVLNCPLLIPRDPKEQEKIADTLSSIDELINAQNQRVDALIIHKKGLIQNLFLNVNEIKNE